MLLLYCIAVQFPSAGRQRGEGQNKCYIDIEVCSARL